MIKLTTINNNCHSVQLGDNEILFSYSTPIALLFEGTVYKVDKFYRVTTSKHFNLWLSSIGYTSFVVTVSEDKFNGLLFFLAH